MSSERIFNIFIFFDDGTASEFGMRHCRHDGSDAEKMAFLQSIVFEEYSKARRFLLRRTFTSAQWLSQQRLGMDLGLFEEGFSHFNAPKAPIVCLTAIVDGLPQIDLSTDLSPFWGEKIGKELPGDIEDWLIKYTEGNVFRFDKLIRDDYFIAIRTLFNIRHIASASKLLMSCIDTMAFVEYGDADKNFVRWIDSYVDITSVGITSAELWEFRNSIVHMTNIASRKVLAGKIAAIMPYIGSDDMASKMAPMKFKPFNIYNLILAINMGVGRWAETYNADREKFLIFIERYDTIISDSRLAEFAVAPIDIDI
jgi:hypothetical protein